MVENGGVKLKKYTFYMLIYEQCVIPVCLEDKERLTTMLKVPKSKSSKHYRRYISDHHKSIDEIYAFFETAD